MLGVLQAAVLTVLLAANAAGDAQPAPSPEPTASVSAVPVIDGATPVPTLDRVKLKRGFALEYVTDTGGKIVQTFLGYLSDDRADGCTTAAPCAVWKSEEPDRVYANGTNNGSGYNGRVTGTHFSFYDSDWNLRKEVRPATTGVPSETRRTSLQFMRFPLVLGDVWSSDGRDEDDVQVHRTIKVVGWEHVVVPAGEFDAIHVQTVNESRDNRVRWRSYRHDYYYEPALGIFIEMKRDGYVVDPWRQGPTVVLNQRLVRMFANPGALQ